MHRRCTAGAAESAVKTACSEPNDHRMAQTSNRGSRQNAPRGSQLTKNFDSQLDFYSQLRLNRFAKREYETQRRDRACRSKAGKSRLSVSIRLDDDLNSRVQDFGAPLGRTLHRIKRQTTLSMSGEIGGPDSAHQAPFKALRSNRSGCSQWPTKAKGGCRAGGQGMKFLVPNTIGDVAGATMHRLDSEIRRIGLRPDGRGALRERWPLVAQLTDNLTSRAAFSQKSDS